MGLVVIHALIFGVAPSPPPAPLFVSTGSSVSSSSIKGYRYRLSLYARARAKVPRAPSGSPTDLIHHGWALGQHWHQDEPLLLTC